MTTLPKINTSQLRAVKTHGRDTVIVAINPEEKYSHVIDGKDGPISLFVFADASEDGRLSQPTNGRYLASTVDYFLPNDILVFHHNAIVKANELIENFEGIKPYEKVYSISLASVFFIIRAEKYVPFWPFCLAERLFYKERVSEGGIILDQEPVKINDKIVIKVLPDHPEVEELGLETDQVVLMHVKSDYECTFKRNNKLEHVIRINMERDIIGVDEEMTAEYRENRSPFLTYKNNNNGKV